MSAPQENKELVERASFRVYEEGDLDVIDEAVAEDYVLYDPTVPEPIRGREAFREYVRSYREAFPDLDLTVESIVAEDDLVAVRFSIRGTHEGPIPEFEDLEPTGEEIEITGMEFDRIEDGMVAETWVEYDSLGLLQQLGVLPAEEDPGEPVV